MGQFFSYILKQVHFAQGVIIPCYPLFIFFFIVVQSSILLFPH